MRKIAVDWMDNVATTHLMESTHNWMKDLEKNNTPFPRACEIKHFACNLEALDCATSSVEEFMESQVAISNQVCENKLCNTNFHKHTFTCEKGAKGNFYCRLCMARGLNGEGVRPLMIIVKNKGDMVNKEKAILESHELDDDMMKYADTPSHYDKSFKKHGF